jgi:hypothetical protein
LIRLRLCTEGAKRPKTVEPLVRRRPRMDGPAATSMDGTHGWRGGRFTTSLVPCGPSTCRLCPPRVGRTPSRGPCRDLTRSPGWIDGRRTRRADARCSRVYACRGRHVCPVDVGDGKGGWPAPTGEPLVRRPNYHQDGWTGAAIHPLRSPPIHQCHVRSRHGPREGAPSATTGSFSPPAEFLAATTKKPPRVGRYATPLSDTGMVGATGQLRPRPRLPSPCPPTPPLWRPS